MGPSRRAVALNPVVRSPAMTVVVFQCPAGTAMRQRSPRFFDLPLETDKQSLLAGGLLYKTFPPFREGTIARLCLVTSGCALAIRPSMAETQISPVIHKVSKKAGKATTKSHNEMTPRNVIKKLNVLDTAPNLLPAIHLFRISRAE